MQRLLITLLVIFVISNSFGQGKISDKEIDQYVLRVMKEFDVPGISLAIVKDGKVLLAKGYGVRKKDAAPLVDDNTLFGIASNTKAFTATALALLVEEGKIKWDDPVINHLPWFRLSDPFVTRELAIRDLLVHSSGLGLGAGDLLWWPPSTYDRKEIVRRLRNLPLVKSFRSTYAYDNVLYTVAGEVIEAVSGMSWEDFVTQRILLPAGMTGSVMRTSGPIDKENVAITHAKIDGIVRPVKPFTSPNTNPAGGINSNAVDMAKWMIVQLDSGRISGSKQLFSPRTTADLWRIVTPMPIRTTPKELTPLNPNFYGYALGFVVNDYRGLKIVSHTGGLPGYLSRLTLLPEKKLGITVLTNQESGGAFNAITYFILDRFLDAPKHDWISGFKKVELRADSLSTAFERSAIAKRDTTSRPSLLLEKYAGTYRDAWYGDITITKENDNLTIRFTKTPDLTGTLEHWQYDTFIAQWHNRELRADAYVSFSLNPDGSIDQVKLRAVSPSTDFSFDFHDLLLKPVR